MRRRASTGLALLVLAASGWLVPAGASAPREAARCVPRHGTVVLSWSTESEVDIIGFDVFRGKLKLNCKLILAKHPGEFRGASYTYRAQDGPGDFKLRIANRDGTYTWFAETG